MGTNTSKPTAYAPHSSNAAGVMRMSGVQPAAMRRSTSAPHDDQSRLKSRPGVPIDPGAGVISTGTSTTSPQQSVSPTRHLGFRRGRQRMRRTLLRLTTSATSRPLASSDTRQPQHQQQQEARFFAADPRSPAFDTADCTQMPAAAVAAPSSRSPFELPTSSAPTPLLPAAEDDRNDTQTLVDAEGVLPSHSFGGAPTPAAFRAPAAPSGPTARSPWSSSLLSATDARRRSRSSISSCATTIRNPAAPSRSRSRSRPRQQQQQQQPVRVQYVVFDGNSSGLSRMSGVHHQRQRLSVRAH